MFIPSGGALDAARTVFDYCTVLTCTAPFLPQDQPWVLAIDDFGAQDQQINRKAWGCYGRSPVYGTAFLGPDDRGTVPAELVELLGRPIEEWPIPDGAIAVLLGHEPDRPQMLATRPEPESDPELCEACGEPADNEMAEFVDDEGKHLYCHAQCGLDREWELA